MNRRFLALLTAFLLLAGPAAMAESEPLRSIVVSEPVHLIGYLPLYVAIHEGYFAQEGLDVTVVQATGGAHVTAVVSGDAFAAIGGVDSYNFANQGNNGADSYAPGANGRLYAEVAAIAPEGMPIMFHECGSIPTAQQMEREHAPWAMFMVWHTDFVTDGKSNTPASFKKIYEGEWFITLDELPAFK